MTGATQKERAFARRQHAWPYGGRLNMAAVENANTYLMLMICMMSKHTYNTGKQASLAAQHDLLRCTQVQTLR